MNLFLPTLCRGAQVNYARSHTGWIILRTPSPRWVANEHTLLGLDNINDVRTLWPTLNEEDTFRGFRYVLGIVHCLLNKFSNSSLRYLSHLFAPRYAALVRINLNQSK
jgi:hypothetical protein